eukprot:2086482-Lingulodinium_polyedra.AAC.1
MSQILTPERVISIKTLRMMMAEWERKAKDDEVRYEQVQESVKLAALKSFIPMDLLTSRFRGT